MDIIDDIIQSQDENEIRNNLFKTIVDMYSDKIHFIYELIQNAEDAKASTIIFKQFANRLEVLHNGTPFTRSNLKSLCNIAKSDKKAEYGMIGKFGLGFKSVFTICKKVELFSEPKNFIFDNLSEAPFERFAIRIENYIKPEKISYEWNFEDIYTTKFTFYYTWGENFYYKTENELKKPISEKLLTLGTNILLFLKNLKDINYHIYKDNSENILEHEGVYKLDKRQIDQMFYKIKPIGSNKNNHSYFVFSKNIENTGRTVDIAFPFSENDEKIKFIKADLSNIFVYFPTEIDSKLNFLIQAPFDVSNNRSSLERNSELNDKKLIPMLGELLREAICKFRDKNILSLELLSLLPYHKVDTDSLIKYENRIIRELSIANMLKTENIIPTVEENIYVSAKDAKIARKKELIEIFRSDFLNKLLDQPNAKWLAANFTENNQQLREMHSYFHKELDVDIIGSDDLPKLLKTNPDFLKNVDYEWLIEFYNFLSDPKNRIINLLLGKNGDLATIPFIKTDDGNINAPYVSRKKENYYELEPNIYIKPSNVTYDINGFLFINSYIEEKCPGLIKALDLEEPNKLDYFIKELECGKNAKPTEDENILQLKKAIKFLKYDYEKNINIFKEYLWFRVRKTDDSIDYCKLINSNIYQEFDLNNVSIKDCFLEINCNVNILDEQFYLNNGISSEEIKILLKLGIKDSIYNYISPSKWLIGRAECSDANDFRMKLDILYISEILEFIKNNSNAVSAKNKSAIIMNLLINIEKHLHGIWKHSSTNPEYYEDVSQIVKNLRRNKWLFSKNKLVCSEEISRYDLDAYIYGNVNENSKIYDILGFKKTEQDKKSELIQEILKNFTEEQLNIYIEKFIQKDEEEFDPTINDDEESFPIETIKDLTNLKSKINNRYLSAENVTYETVRRQIRTSRGSDKNHMRNRYHGFCQICQRKNPYWEVAEIFLEPKKELEQMNLSLCPNCASEYRMLRNNRDLMDTFKNEILKANPENEPIVKLHGDKEIILTNTHLAEIQEIIRIENGMKVAKIKLK